jgi:hypothetical protein
VRYGAQDWVVVAPEALTCCLVSGNLLVRPDYEDVMCDAFRKSWEGYLAVRKAWND